MDLLHLAPAGPATGVARLRPVARRECVREARDPAREVAHRGEHATHRRQRPVRIDRLLEPGVGRCDVAVGQPLVRGPRLARSTVESIPSGSQEPVADDVPVLGAGGGRDRRGQGSRSRGSSTRTASRVPRRSSARRAGARRTRRRARPCWRSPHGSSVGSPADIVSRCSMRDRRRVGGRAAPGRPAPGPSGRPGRRAAAGPRRAAAGRPPR